MDKHIKKIEYFPISDMRKTASKHLSVFKTRATRQGQDYKGRQLKTYSKGYTEALERDMRISRGPRKGQRHKGLQGIALETSQKKIARSLFTLRGLSMGPGFGVRRVAKNYYIIGWDGEAATIVDYQAKKGRNLKDDIPDKEYKLIIGMLGKSVGKQWSRVKNKTIRVG